MVSLCHFLTLADSRNLLLAESANDGNQAFLVTFLKDLEDLLANLLEVVHLGQVDVLLDVAVLVEQLKLLLFNVGDEVLSLVDDRSIDHVAGVEVAPHDVIGQDVLALDDDLSGAVLTVLTNSDVENLAGEGLDHDERTGFKFLGFDLFGQASASVDAVELLGGIRDRCVHLVSEFHF